MTRARLAVLASTVVVVLGVAAGIGALWLGSARAAVGPLPGEALILPADARFVMGFDVKRFAASPFYARYAAQRGMKPEALRELEEKTGLDPSRDVERVVVAGTGMGSVGLALVTGRFDLYKIGRTLETEGKSHGYSHEGVTVYPFAHEGQPATAVAFLDETSLLFGRKEAVEAAVASRTRGETPFKANAALVALLGTVRPGSTFWMVGDQSLLAGLPTSMPAPGASADGAAVSLPALQSLTVTGDLDPDVSLSIAGQAKDEPSAKSLADVVRGLVALASLQAQQKPELQQLASAVTVATQETRILVSARIPYAMIDALQAKANAEATPAPAATTGK
jgi:hypothetical protein